MSQSSRMHVSQLSGVQELRRGFLKKATRFLAAAAMVSGVAPLFGQVKSTASAVAPGSGVAQPLASEPFLGEICLVGFNFAPVGWAFCDGSLLAISQNTALFALLGTTFGGDGRSTFALPDLRGRVPLGFGQGPGLSPYNLGDRAGEETHSLSLQESPSHTHTFNGTASVASTDSPAGMMLAKNAAGIPQYATGTVVPMNSTSVQPAGGGLPHNNVQPYLAINYIIALQGIFPSRQ